LRDKLGKFIRPTTKHNRSNQQSRIDNNRLNEVR